MKVLFIDSDTSFLEVARDVLRDQPDIVFAECHSLDDATSAIQEHCPGMIFLEHQLSPDGDEGYEIVARLTPDVTAYSTTMLRHKVQMYTDLGIENVGGDVSKMAGIIRAARAQT